MSACKHDLPIHPFRNDTSADEIRAPGKREPTVHNHSLDVNARAKDYLKSIDQIRIKFDVATKRGARLFGMQQAEPDATSHEFG